MPCKAICYERVNFLSSLSKFSAKKLGKIGKRVTCVEGLAHKSNGRSFTLIVVRRCKHKIWRTYIFGLSWFITLLCSRAEKASTSKANDTWSFRSLVFWFCPFNFSYEVNKKDLFPEITFDCVEGSGVRWSEVKVKGMLFDNKKMHGYWIDKISGHAYLEREKCIPFLIDTPTWPFMQYLQYDFDDPCGALGLFQITKLYNTKY